MDGKFNQKDVKWTLGDIEMEATVTWPEDGEKYPGLVLVAGSGPTDRNWCSPLIPGTNGSGKLIAEALSESGYATIRYDKRASGPHVQENIQKLMGKISMSGHTEEVNHAVRALIENTDVDRKRIFALTNSEGAIHALNYQMMPAVTKFSGLILTGVPARSVGDVAREQILNQIASLDNSETLIQIFNRAVSGFENGKPYVPDPTVPATMDLLLRSITSPANQPFSLELWKTNPIDMIKGVSVPMLLIIGKKDIQVNWKKDGSILENSLSGRSNVTIEFPENADHVLKYEEAPRDKIDPVLASNNYNGGTRYLDDGTLRVILDWLRTHRDLSESSRND